MVCSLEASRESAFWKPFSTTRVLEALKVKRPAEKSTVVVLAREGFIWEETKRSQMMEYSRNSSEVRCFFSFVRGARDVGGPDGLMGVLRALARRVDVRGFGELARDTPRR